MYQHSAFVDQQMEYRRLEALLQALGRFPGWLFWQDQVLRVDDEAADACHGAWIQGLIGYGEFRWRIPGFIDHGESRWRHGEFRWRMFGVDC